MRQDGSIERIVVGLDGSSSSAQALEWAIRMARCSGAEIIAVHAWRPTHGPLALSADSKEARRQTTILFEHSWCTSLASSNLAHRRVFTDGNPVSVLIKTATQDHADLIVVGARGLGGFAGLLLGSVSQQLAAYSPVPIVLVPAPPKALSEAEQESYRSAARRLTFSEIA